MLLQTSSSALASGTLCSFHGRLTDHPAEGTSGLTSRKRSSIRFDDSEFAEFEGAIKEQLQLGIIRN